VTVLFDVVGDRYLTGVSKFKIPSIPDAAACIWDGMGVGLAVLGERTH